MCFKQNSSAISSLREKKIYFLKTVTSKGLIARMESSTFESLLGKMSTPPTLEAMFFDYHKNCTVESLILPLFYGLFSHKIIQSATYLLMLLLLFLGVAIISDIFMCAIETITSSTKIIMIKSATSNEIIEKEVKIWNESVANLTLMALGSSAPEILLSIIEIVGGGFNAGDLGAGTIVGSAAFNLLIITGVCVISIPGTETRKIKSFKVFLVTSFFSVFAYVWLLIILVFNTPEIIDLWEALLTFLFFPILTIIAFCADKNFFMKSDDEEEDDESIAGISRTLSDGTSILGDITATGTNYFPKGKLTKKSLLKFMSDLRKIQPSISDEDAACLAAANLFENQPKSRLFYRVSAVRSLSGSRSPVPKLNQNLQAVHEMLKKGPFSNKSNLNLSLSLQNGNGKNSYNVNHAFDESEDMPVNVPSSETVAAEHANYRGLAVVQFESPTVTVMENDTFVVIKVIRAGKLDVSFTCFVETIDRTAVANVDYIPLSSEITFKMNQKEEKIKIPIIDNNEWNPDKIFLVKLSLTPETMNIPEVAKGRICIMSVVIVDDDDPGQVTFTSRLLTLSTSDALPVITSPPSINNMRISIPVLRENGCDGKITVFYKTIDGTAKSGHDFSPVNDGQVVFNHKQSKQTINMNVSSNLFDDDNPNGDLFFEIELTSSDPSSCLSTSRYTKTMIVFNHHEKNLQAIKLLTKIRKQQEGFKLNIPAWKSQIKRSMTVNGGDDEEGGDGDPTTTDYVLHVISFGWKVFFSIIIPPTTIYGGWVSFFCSLAVIGVLTAIIGDVATTFGCLVGLEKSVNAITFVAMGTSLPDLFASRAAARMDPHADNAIGNVTGSNSVNVFLGLGLPWLLAAVYWQVKGAQFKVPSGNLAFAVALYAVVAMIAIFTLMIRRFVSCFGGELGGPRIPAILTTFLFIFLWLFYVTLSALQAYDALGM